jgi:NAD(P)-dependent dehydrogenase (short-subunit alcohol dehydrogenase family)
LDAYRRQDAARATSFGNEAAANCSKDETLDRSHPIANLLFQKAPEPDGGAIILTASVAGANGGLGGSTIYGSTKAALRSFGRTIAKELTPRGIRVNTISPGPIVTPILDKGGLTPAQKDNFIEGAKTRIPLGRTGTAAEVAAAALYLAADATYTTGAELFVDGGLIDL